jgi:hypothetical protein
MTPDELKQYLAQLRAAFADDPAVWPETAEALILVLTEGEEPAESDPDLLELMSVPARQRPPTSIPTFLPTPATQSRLTECFLGNPGDDGA